ncbi:hypothetical protein ACHAQA_009498 [Verticillium albo-atrum]
MSPSPKLEKRDDLDAGPDASLEKPDHRDDSAIDLSEGLPTVLNQSDPDEGLDELTAPEPQQLSPSTSSTGKSAGKRKRTPLPNSSYNEPDELTGMDDTDEKKRNPKRKATEAIVAQKRQSDDPLKDAMAPVSMEDIRQWPGWCELESEPAFFNAILRDYGVKDVKIQELFSLDEDSLSFLPQPVYGLIFLYQYFSQDCEVDEQDQDNGVWFANQTTDNACATVAMMNIIMNSDIEIGPQLQSFRDTTKDMGYALRGHSLSQNTHIRTIHNSLTRRMDHLNADLWLGNSATTFKKNAKKRKAAPKAAAKKKPATPKRKKKLKVDSDSGFHFIAIVPSNGSVWELDGLKNGPVNLGPVADDGEWVSTATPFIQDRMLQLGEGAVHFNMMALCKSPLSSASARLAQSVRHFDLIHERTKGDQAFKDLVNGNPPPLAEDDEQLKKFGLTRESIQEASVDARFERKVNNPSMEAQELFEMYDELVTAQKIAMGEYRDEQASLSVDEQRLLGRKRDHMSAIHRWLEAIAAHGKLEDMING